MNGWPIPKEASGDTSERRWDIKEALRFPLYVVWTILQTELFCRGFPGNR